MVIPYRFSGSNGPLKKQRKKFISQVLSSLVLHQWQLPSNSLELKKTDAANKMTDYGKKLKSFLIEAADEFGYKFIVSESSMPYFRLLRLNKSTFLWIENV
ncbi:MAG: hypothetical protein Ct9H300mP3_11250 [Gammaproteobacteria bacterium]|nr:MAG: hypothetical protein Ct9H300mP3_11250 [Gammaproteobacteria bacterium]